MKPDGERPAFGDFSDIPDVLPPSLDRAPLPLAPPGRASPNRAQFGQRRALALGVAALWPLVPLAVWGLRPRASAGLGFLAAQGVTWIALLLVAAFVAFSGGRRGLGRSVRSIEAVVLGALFSFLVVALLWLPSGSAGGFAEIGPASLLTPCVTLGMLVAAPMLLVAAWPLRRTLPSGAGWRGAALGAAAGFAAVLVLTLHCSSTFGGHVALAHGAPVVLATLAGAAFGARAARC